VGGVEGGGGGRRGTERRGINQINWRRKQD